MSKYENLSFSKNVIFYALIIVLFACNSVHMPAFFGNLGVNLSERNIKLVTDQ